MKGYTGMKNKIADWENRLAHKLVDFTARRQGIEIGSDQYEMRLYGAKCDINNLEKTLIVYPIALFLGILPYVLAMGISTASLRKRSFGLHMPSSMACLVEGLIVFLGGGLITLHVRFHLRDVLVLFILILLCVNAYAPAQTKKRPIPDSQKDDLRKQSLIKVMFWSWLAGMLIILSWTVPTMVGIRLEAIGFSLMLGLSVQAIHLTPVMFRLFERS